MNRSAVAAAAVCLCLILNACDTGGSAVATRDRETASPAPAAAPQALAETAPEADAPAAEAPRPAMTANRRETSQDKVARLFQTNGADFGARTEADYVRMVHAFVSSPPPGTEQVTRGNGDVIFYQAATNTFAVVDRHGAPRTMFKPRGGGAYWERQKAQAPDFGRRRGS